MLFVGVSDNGEAFGLTLDEIERTKNLIAVVTTDISSRMSESAT